jgi:N-acyl-D-aspartate/D-glutamate deacylase
MVDICISGGTVVDGTGTTGFTGDLGITDGRIVAITKGERLKEPATTTIDADGLVVTPGFIDVHTHYDAQAFWDTTLSPSPLHGVTTVFGGNCGFTIAPITPRDGEYLMRMLSRVEGMPLESLQQGVPWNWTSTAEYLDMLDGTLMPNAGFLVGHSAIRRVVMREEATQRASTPEELAAMAELLRAGLRAGGMGFSSTWSPTHNDHDGDGVPSRHATADELIALCAVVGEFPGTQLEFIPGVGPFSEELHAVMAAMSRTANRPLNWNVLQVYGSNIDAQEQQLAASDYAAANGGRVLALTLPDSLRTRLTFMSGFVLDLLPNWAKIVTLPMEERRTWLADADKRRQLDEWAQTVETRLRGIANWSAYRLETFAPANAAYDGRLVADVASELGKSPWDTLCDIVLADDMRTGLFSPDRGQDDASWKRRVDVWRDPRTLVGASDAGAHLDMIDSYSFSTTMLGRAVRERNLLPMEEAVAYITDVPARTYGVKQRGRLAVGWHADVTVLDPSTIGPGPLETRFDLPGGAGRLYGQANGIEHVLVNGVPVVRGREFLAARPGTLLRSGRDTETVTTTTEIPRPIPGN